RRQFTKLGMAAGIVFCLGESKAVSVAQKPQVSITMDDFNWAGNSVKLTASERNEAILATLRSRSLKAALFVRGSNIDNEQGMSLLQAWNTAGHLIGNHSYSHWYFHSAKITSEAFKSDILRCEELLKSFSRYRKFFRFPYLKEGDTSVKRDAIRAFLEQHGYRNGHVTIDASDWIVDERLRKRLTKEPTADPSPYRRFYIALMWDRAQYYDSLSQKVLGRRVKHTILVHFNLLNALFLGDLIDMFKSKGWRVIDAEQAFTDSVFTSQPKIVPAGESLIWALAKETGRFEKLLRYPGEDGEYETAKMDKLGL
ncbi:MAG TPA: polysaccharide deacetylase family protein, partial [Pyrinomonadaceae bacterium]|nr:polysaccharide deacetylase family protein [Pyrinomonadaceae bacterium]